jgi:hypothetical protein
MIITAIDPGTDESGIVMWTPSGKPILAEKAKNEWIKSVVGMYTRPERVFVIEEINPYTMGKTIRDTILWSGRFQEAIESRGGEVVYLSRNQIRQALCGSAGPRINDTAIKQALVDRFAYGQKNFGKGTKKEPGFFYGFSKDIWQAFALAVAYAKINGFLNDK